MKKTLSWLIVLAMVFAMIPAVFAAEESEVTYTKISSMEELTTGQYVIVCENNVGVGNLDGTWVLTTEPTIEGDVVTDAAGAVYTITVDGTNVTLQDGNGKYIAPKSGNTNGIQEGQYSWAVSCADGMFKFAGQGSDTTVLASNGGSQNKFRAYKTSTVSGNPSGYPSNFALYKLDEAVEEPEVPVEPELPENALVIGDNAVELPANETFVEYTYTATEAGTLYIEFTDVGYVSTYSGSYSAQNVEERFNGINGMSIWFAAYINDVQMPAGYKGAIELAAGETATLKWEYVTYTFAANVKQGTVNVSFEGGSSEGGDVVEPVEGEIFNVETTDTYGYFDTYTFVAPVSGEYTFHIPAGLGLTTPEKDANWEMPIIDFYDNAEGYAHVIDLYAGQEYEVMVGALEKANWEIIYTVVEKEVEGPTEPDVPVVPPVVEAPVVELGEAIIDADTLYSYTAAADGTLKIDVSTGSMQYGAFQGTVYDYGTLALEIDGVEVTTARGVYEMEVVAGQVVTIKVVVKSSMYAGAKINLKLDQEAPVAPSNDVFVGTTVIDADVLYTFTATEAGILKIDAATGSMQYGNFQGTVYDYGTLALEIDGVEVTTARGLYEMEVAAGQVVTIKVVVKSSMYAGAKINLVLSMEEPPAPALGNGENNAEGGIVYEYTATANGSLSINAVGGNLMWTGMGNMPINANLYAYGNLKLVVNGEELSAGTHTIDVAEGDVITIQVKVVNAAYTDVKPVITLTLTEAEAPAPELVLGENNAEGGIEYIFNVTESGKLNINAGSGNLNFYGSASAYQGSFFTYGNLKLYVNGEEVAAANAGVIEIDVTAGQAVTVKVEASNANITNLKPIIVLSMAEGEIDPPVVEPETPGTGTQNDPFNITTVPYEATQNSGDDLYYQYIATEAGTLYVYYADGTVGVTSSNGAISWQSVEGGKSIEVAAGDAITINAWRGNTGIQVDFVGANVEPEDPTGPEVGSGTGTKNDPFIIAVPSEQEQDASADLYYQFTAPEDGKILVLYTNGVCALSGSSVGSWESMAGGKYMEVAAGDVITINYWNGTGFSVAYEEVSDEFQGTVLENAVGVNVSLAAGQTALYKWVATKDGEVTVTLDSYTFYGAYAITATVNGTAFNLNAVVLNVQAGDELIFEFKVPAYVGSGSLVFSASYPEEHVCDFVEVERVDETCTVDGYVKYECECGEHYTETLPAPGSHNFVEGSCGICGEADPDYVPECEHNYVDGVCTNCGEADPDYVPDEPSNPGTGSMNILAIALIAMMSATAVVVTAKKSDEE